MTKVFSLVAALFLTALTTFSQTPKTADDTGPIQVTLKTVGSLLGSPTTRYQVGDQIVVTITMTNTSATPQTFCISSGLYQNVPRLTRDNVVVPFMKWQSYEQLNAERNRTCQDVNLPEPVLLKPNESKVLDYFVIVDSKIATGADAWYDALPPGKYEISLQRRLDCCDGPLVQSNKVSFEVVE